MGKLDASVLGREVRERMFKASITILLMLLYASSENVDGPEAKNIKANDQEEVADDPMVDVKKQIEQLMKDNRNLLEDFEGANFEIDAENKIAQENGDGGFIAQDPAEEAFGGTNIFGGNLRRFV